MNESIHKSRQSYKSTTLTSTTRQFNLPLHPNHFKSNKICTHKYNCLTFIPKNIWEQFNKLANVYFLFLAVLQSIPQTSNSNGIPSIMLPLSMILLISAFKDLSEDNKRKKSDNEENNKKVLKRVEGDWRAVKWESVLVGDILKIRENEFFPADLVLLQSSEPKGMCYVETKNLDGETNLKHKLAEKYSQTTLQDPAVLDNFKCEIKCDEANPMIYNFNGVVKHSHSIMALSYEQLLLRGTSLKNTDWVVGVCVYSGHETKIMLNSPKHRSKFSNLERGINKQILFIFIGIILICLLCTAYYSIWYSYNKDDTNTYLGLKKENKSQVFVFFITFISWFLLIGSLIPISLIVTLEIVKVLQALFISSDLDIYSEDTDIPAVVQSSNLNEDLGQIRYIFSDKTGTLTCNIMEFKRLCINGTSYGSEDHVPLSQKLPHVDFVDPSFNPKHESSREFLLHMAICHTIVCEFKDGAIDYKASSPDELALVNAARFFGMQFNGRDGDQSILVKTEEGILVFRVLNIIEFNSDRKRMTIIVRTPSGQIRLYIKGADSMILPLLASGLHKEETIECLENYANSGLRTLVFAIRDLSEDEYRSWNNEYLDAIQDIKNKEARISELAEKIERELKLIGASAIEDKLQDRVPETIKVLREAGIKIWVLTGDKIETATNIGFSCNLLSPEMLLITIAANKAHLVKEEIKEGLLSMKESPISTFSLVISGEALLRAFREDTKSDFLKLAESCAVVLACRVSPQQKADLVKLVKDNNPSIRTLSIGDGANDVNMITTAHVGIGLAGLEGKQAARAADYSIAQFYYLHNLLFVHGRECYRRNANMIFYIFYKNVVFYFPIIYFGFLSVFSGQIFYNTWMTTVYSLIYTAVPIGFYSIFDKEKRKEELLAKPELYRLGIEGKLFTVKAFLSWMVEGLIQSAFLMFGTVYFLGQVTGLESGRMMSLSVVAYIVYGLVVIIVNVKVYMISFIHYWFTILTMILCVFSYFLIGGIITDVIPPIEAMLNFDGWGTVRQLSVNINFYIWLIVATYGSFCIQPVISSVIRIKEMKDTWKKPVDDDSKRSELLDKKSILQDEQKMLARESIARYSQRHTGYAFSGDAGHDLPITDPKFYENQRMTE